jgi:lysylphosphatidylglycerol synthetase-like protein (DUF2156 family)
LGRRVAEMADVPLNVRIALLRQHGSFVQAYSVAVQQSLLHYGDERGFISYKEIWGTAMVLADPIAPPQLVDDLVGRFMRDNPDAVFWHISRSLASCLAARGFLINELGVETRLDLTDYSFAGKRKRNLRKAASRMARLEYVTKECSLASIDIKEIKAVSDLWRRTRTFSRRELGFLIRPLVLDEEPDVRRFFAFDRDGKLVGFGFCDPMYAGGEVVGYSISTRNRPDVDFMVGHALKRCAIETFQKEGKKWLSLGLSPAEGIEDQDFVRDWLTRRALRFAYNSPLFNRFVFPMQGHAVHKRQFGGITEQTYLAFNTAPSLPRLLKVFGAVFN